MFIICYVYNVLCLGYVMFRVVMEGAGSLGQYRIQGVAYALQGLGVLGFRV